jgi:sulfatase modifying factor 1
LYVYDTSPTSGWHPTFATNVTPYTNPGGSFAANGYELYDMAGNVWEWCWDRYRSGTYTNSPYLNPCGVSTGGANRVIRGGCWVNDGKCAKGARVSYREGHVPNDENNNTGFRCARRL